MSPSLSSSALQQARSINFKRLAALICFALVMLLCPRVSFPVPGGAFVVFAIWIAAASLYQLNIRRLASLWAAETMQATMLLLDITLLTGLYAIVGGGWWMSATVYIVVANAAFASLPKKLGWAVSA